MESLISKDKSCAIKGIMALLVILHHVYQYGNILHDAEPLSYILQSLGYLSVAVFFFISGYGNYISHLKNGQQSSWKTQILKKTLPIYHIYLLLLAIWATLMLSMGEDISHKDIILSLTFGGTILPLGWYIQSFIVITIIYIFSTYTSKHHIRNMLVGTIIYVMACMIINAPHHWYSSSCCFWVGMLCAKHSSEITNYINIRLNRITLTISIILLISLFFSYFTYHRIALLIFITRTFTAISFCLFIVILFKHFHNNSKVTTVQ